MLFFHSKSVPFSLINLTNPDSNPAQFLFKFPKIAGNNIMNGFSAMFKSDIAIITYNISDFKTTQIDDFTLMLSVIVPITSFYNVTFKWENKDIGSLFYNISDVTNVPENVSSLECFGEYEHRWCRAKRICWQNKRFVFFGLKNAKINRTSMIPGARPIPHDYPKCRVVVQYKMIHSNYPLNNFTKIYKQRSFLTCRWYSMEYLWHALFDYTLPLYWTTKLNGGSNRTEDLIFTIDENTSKKGYQFLDPFTNHSIENIKVNWEKYNNICFDNAIIGFPKSEFNISHEKWKENSFLLPYEYPIQAFLGFREKMISYYKSKDYFEKYCEPNGKNPRVVIAYRNASMRDIINKKEVVDAVKDACPYCIVDSYIYGGESFGEQLARYCNASILFGMHGSQLSHMVWMKINDPKKPTAIIEIKPYKYTCRDWYKQIADGAGIKYYQWINTNPNNTRTGREKSKAFDRNKYIKCINGEYSCYECHDYLRDQPTIVDIKSFIPVFLQALKHVTSRK